MIRRALRCFCSAVLLLAVIPCAPAADLPPIAFRIAGYLPEYRLASFDPTQARFLTDLILFSAEPTDSGGLNLKKLEQAPWPMLRELKTKQGLRLILCVGGWERSTPFAKVATSPQLRKKFAQAAVKTCLDNRLDGLDLDWEHPRDEKEMQGYADLLTELKSAFVPHGLVLSVTMSSWQRIPPAGYEAADWVQIMSYDNNQRHSTLEQAKKDGAEFLARQIPSEKILLGMPFYGRGIQDRNKTMTYAEINKQYELTPNVDEINGIFFNGPATIKAKTRFALDSHLGGVMVWELGQDAPGDQSLLKVIHETVSNTPR